MLMLNNNIPFFLRDSFEIRSGREPVAFLCEVLQIKYKIVVFCKMFAIFAVMKNPIDSP